MKKTLCVALSLFMLVSMLPSSLVAYADTVSWKAGDNVTATVKSTSDGASIVISGKGKMYDYQPSSRPDWFVYANQSDNQVNKIEVENGVTSVGNYAFANLMGIKSVELASSVESIGTAAFLGDYFISAFNLPSSLNSIGDRALSTFMDSDGNIISKLSSISVSSDNKFFTFEDGILYNKAKTVVYKAVSTAVKNSLSINANVLQIKQEAFAGCTLLTDVSIPVNTEDIGQKAFIGCKGLTQITFNNKGHYTIGTNALPDNKGAIIYGYNNTAASLYTQTNNCANLTFSAIDKDPCENGHTIVVDKAVAATCTKTGLTEGSHCSVCGNTIVAQKVVAAKGHTYKNYVTAATTSKDGKIVKKCSVCGVVYSTTVINKASSVALSAYTYTYNAKSHAPNVIVKDSKGKVLKHKTDYIVTYPKTRVNTGRYTIKIQFIGNYSGTVYRYYNIVPKGATIKSTAAYSKALRVQWNLQKTQTTGYQVQYSTSSSFKNAKTVTVAKNTNYAKKITGLSGNKRYYVRVRTYRTIKFGGKNYNLYSSWSGSKSIVTKR